uniref:RAP2A, member of RAS onco family n=1 Tax=Saimiri boliviensis boliviensis TaxID=39432 RepID=A0A2K6UKA1_SAIBB
MLIPDKTKALGVLRHWVASGKGSCSSSWATLPLTPRLRVELGGGSAPSTTSRVDSSPSVLEILDTAGTEQFASMRDLYIKNGQGFILVYSLVNQQSFQDIKPMRDQIIRVKRYEKVPVILVGNKVDLESEREVSSNEGRALAEEWGCPFMETSAKSKTMVDELFAEIVRQMNYAAQPDKDDPCCSACNIQ